MSYLSNKDRAIVARSYTGSPPRYISKDGELVPRNDEPKAPITKTPEQKWVEDVVRGPDVTYPSGCWVYDHDLSKGPPPENGA